MSGRADRDRLDRYSRTIAWLKVALPLAALAILSTLFLVSRAMQTETAIPFAEKEIQDRLRGQQITGPFFSGTSSSGDELSFSADKLYSPEGAVGTNRAENVRARIATAGSASFQLSADSITLSIADDFATLEGDVTIVSSTGYRVSTPVLTTQVSAVELHAPETVNALGPIGTLTAGSMTISAPSEGESTQMLFSDGVKLVYTPN